MTLVHGPELLNFLRTQGREWVRAERSRHRPRGRTLAAAEYAHFAPFFEASILDRTRIVNVSVIANPDFYDVLAQNGITIPIDFTQMSAITFVDAILLSKARAVAAAEELPLLFHELVHVVQYAVLGLEEFVRRYVNGWAENGFQYANIPLERWAYELDARFRSGSAPFSVAAAVSAQLS